MFHLVDVRLDHPRGGPPIVSGANLAVAKGEVVVIVGAAGVGTSRLVAAALGELRLDDGQLEVLGREVSKLRRSSLRLLRRRVGIVPQDLCLLEDRSAQLNVVMPLEIDGIPRSVALVRAAEILTRLGLESEASRPVDCLAASARQRVAVARALVREPSLVIADQPTSMQDEHGAELVCSAFAEAALLGAGCVVFGRDPALRAIAERNAWRQFALIDGALLPIAEHGRSVEEILISFESAPVPLQSIARVSADSIPDAIPNVLAFPISVRTAAGGAG